MFISDPSSPDSESPRVPVSGSVAVENNGLISYQVLQQTGLVAKQDGGVSIACDGEGATFLITQQPGATGAGDGDLVGPGGDPGAAVDQSRIILHKLPIIAMTGQVR